jgi:hypothetical protein
VLFYFVGGHVDVMDFSPIREVGSHAKAESCHGQQPRFGPNIRKTKLARTGPQKFRRMYISGGSLHLIMCALCTRIYALIHTNILSQLPPCETALISSGLHEALRFNVYDQAGLLLDCPVVTTKELLEIVQPFKDRED